MSLYKRGCDKDGPDGTCSRCGDTKRCGPYWFTFWHNGERVQESSKTTNRKLAEKRERTYWTRLEHAEFGILEAKLKPKDAAVGELLDGLGKYYRSEGKASPQNVSTLTIARRAFGAKKSLTKEDVDRYIDSRLAKGAKPATVNRILEAVRRTFEIARLAAPEIRHLSETGNARKGFFTVAELEKVVENLPEDLRDFTRFAFTTAWRKSEAASLCWSDVEDGVIRLRAAKSKNREARQVIVDGEITEIIKRCQASRAVETPEGTLLSEYIFHRSGEPIQEFRKSWARACVAAGVGKMVCAKCKSEGEALTCCKRPTKYRGKIFHDLRRSGVRDMIRSGVPQSVAMKISGHKTASMFRRYDIASESDLRQAMVNVQKYREAERQKVISIAER